MLSPSSLPFTEFNLWLCCLVCKASEQKLQHKLAQGCPIGDREIPVAYEPLSTLLVSPLITLMIILYIIPYITPFKEFRLWLILVMLASQARLILQASSEVPVLIMIKGRTHTGCSLLCWDCCLCCISCSCRSIVGLFMFCCTPLCTPLKQQQ